MKNIFYNDALRIKKPVAFHVMAKPAGPSCNLSCTYCYYLEKKKFYNGENVFKMDESLIENFVKQYIEAQEVPIVTFTWQGGEPTLMGLDFFKKTIKLQNKYKGKKKIENAFQTNGTMLDDNWCKFFKDNDMLVGISIDGEEHNHDHFRRTSSGGPSFKRVMKGIELLRRNKVDFNTLSVVNSYNARYAAETYKFLKEIGSGFMQFLPVAERLSEDQSTNQPSLVSNSFRGEAKVAEWSVGSMEFGEFLITIFDEWVRNDVASYYIQIFDTTLANYVGENPGLCIFSETCGAALALEHNGDLYSCDHFVFPEYYLGNITETRIAEMVKSRQQIEFGIDKRNKLPTQCKQCDVRYACHGECPKHRFQMTSAGEPGLNYLCEGYKRFFHHVEPYMEFMARELNNKRAPANVMKWIRSTETKLQKPVLPERNSPCPCGSGKKFKMCCSGNTLYLK
jgi:uncharacterized protein